MADDDITPALKQASQSIDRCVDRCRSVAGEHQFAGSVHDTLRSLHAQVPDEALRGRLQSEMGSLAQLHKNVAQGHDQLRRGLEAASLAVGGAQYAVGDPYVEPDHGPQGGTQVNPYGPPRGFSAEEIRQRDQRAGIELGYRAKLKAMRGH